VSLPFLAPVVGGILVLAVNPHRADGAFFSPGGSKVMYYWPCPNSNRRMDGDFSCSGGLSRGNVVQAFR
jgi:hypothetical protein